MDTFSDVWLRSALLHLWQATLFGLLITLLISFLPGPARLRHFAACLAFLRFLIPAGLLAPALGHLPFASVGALWKTVGLGDFMMPAFIAYANDPQASPSVMHLPLSSVLIALWIAGTVICFSLGILRLFAGLRAVKRQAVPFSTEDAVRLERLAHRVGIAPGRVSGYTVSSSSWLGVIGLFRSRILVPEGLFSTLDEKEVESVLLHELVHVKRRDNLLRLLQAGVVALFWFHPLVWWLDRRLHWESESACDEAVLSLTNANRIYAAGLFKAVRYALELNLPGVSGMSRMGLQSRIQAVLNHQNRKDSPVKIALMTSALVGLLGLTTLLANPPTASDPVHNPKTSTGEILNLADVDQIPVVVKQVPPRYPAELKKAGITGKTLVVFVVDTDGNAVDVRVEKTSDPRFSEAAIEAVQQWKFKSGTKAGRPVNVQMAVPMVFAIQN